MTALVARSDSRCLPLADSTVDLIVTSPPYFALRSYTDGGEHYAGQVGDEATPTEFLDSLIICTTDWLRVLKPTGSLWVNLGDKYSSGSSGDRNNGFNERTGNSPGRRAQERSQLRSAPAVGMRPKSLLGLPWRYALRCVDELGLILRAEVIWSKPNGLPESVTDRVRRSHEQWFHFTQEPRYFSALDEVREPHVAQINRPGRDTSAWTVGPPANRGLAARSVEGQHVDFAQNPLGRLPGSVWEIPTQPLHVPASIGIDHFAAFPLEWPRRIIKGWSPANGVVLDPFGGTGTTALVASSLGRTGISVDLSHDYSRLARWRTTDPGERARAMQVEKPPVEIDGQGDLFGGAA